VEIRVLVNRIWPFALALAIIIVDQMVKRYIVDLLRTQDPVQLVGDLLQFTMVMNTGVAFGLFQGFSQVLSVLSAGLILVVVYYLFKTLGHSFITTFALSLVLGGAIGNLIDRVRLGYVIDFIKVPHWPAFNVADSCIVVGVSLLILHMLWQERRQRTSRMETAG
jgi:signal peptidase II